MLNIIFMWLLVLTFAVGYLFYAVWVMLDGCQTILKNKINQDDRFERLLEVIKSKKKGE